MTPAMRDEGKGMTGSKSVLFCLFVWAAAALILKGFRPDGTMVDFTFASLVLALAGLHARVSNLESKPADEGKEER